MVRARPRCMMTGLRTLRIGEQSQMVEDFHRHGVRVLFPMMMWDQGTRQPELPWPQAIAKLMKSVAS